MMVKSSKPPSKEKRIEFDSRKKDRRKEKRSKDRRQNGRDTIK